MKVYISVDMEGISGISGSEFVLHTGRQYAEGRRYYTWDINACVRGCYAGGADEVLVRDGHGDGHHALWDELDPRVEIVQGARAERRFPGLEGSDAFILLGYHALAGTPKALLEHSYSSASIQNLWLNGRPVGEVGIDAAIAGAMGIPTILVTGDDKVCAEARAWMSEVVTCQVKTGLGTQCARLLPKATAHRLIEESSAEAVRRARSMPPLRVSAPVTIRKEVIERGAIPTGRIPPYMRVLDARTYEVTADTVEEAFDRL